MNMFEVSYNLYDLVNSVYVVASSYEHAIKLFKMNNDNEINTISIMREEVISPINEQLDTKIKPVKTQRVKKHNDSLDNIEELLYVSLSLTKEEASFLSQYIDFKGE